ncbi:MAG: outer membrane beta-barrel protein [Prevotella sp.]|nr:outer membrane beta-barrel protein [Prevotella sp.]
MKQKDWTDQLRDRLADHQAPVNDDLWADIEARLDQAAPTPRPLLRRLRWPAVAAAAVALLLGSSTLLLWDGSESEPHMMATAPVAPIETDELITAQVPADEPVTAQVPADEPVTAQVRANQPSRSATEVTAEPTNEEAETTPTEQEETETPERADTLRAPTMPSPHRTTTPTPTPHITHQQKPLLAATFYTENGFADWQQSERVLMSREMADRFAASEYANGSRAQSPVWLADFEERQHHDRPLTLGLRVSYSLNSRLSLSSGLVYTRLHSEFTTVMRGEGVERQQTLHYVGLPLSVQYRLLRYRRFSLYASAGTEVDWNVSARLSTQGTTTDGERDRCQWSFCGSMGMAYDLTPALSVYAEPGIHHYPDNHSTVQNYFKDRPTAFSLQMGLRLQLGKKE